MRSRIAIICSLAFVLTFAAYAGELPDSRWIGLKSRQAQKPELKALGSTSSGVTISAEIKGLETGLAPTAMVGTDKEKFTQLILPGYAYTGELGKPKLPMITAVLDAPLGARIEVKVVSANYREVPLSDWGIDSRIIPALESVEKVEGAKASFVIDDKTYSTDAYYPSNEAEVYDNSIEGGLSRGHRLVTVRLYPVQYNPATGKVRYATDMQVRVDFVGGDWNKTKAEVEKDYSPAWEEFIRRTVVNYDPSQYKAPPSLPIYYDIFYGQNFAAAAQRLAEWKTKKGFKVRMNMAGGWTAAAVNDSIRLRSPIATYVTIISDPNTTGADRIPASATIPTGSGGTGDQTDLYYSEINESGYLPDLYNARISVKTGAEADIAIDKLIKYEKADFGAAGTAWLKKALLIAGYDGSWQWLGIATNEYCRQILVREGYTTIDTLIIGSSENNARIKARVNDGRAWTIYTAHGSQTAWAISSGGSVTVSDLSTLTNQDMHTFAAGHCCLANDYEYSSDCFGETWPRLGNKAGVSYYGSVPSTYWDEDDWLQRRYFDAIYDSVPGQPNLKMPEPGRFTQYGLYWIQNNTSTSLKQYYFEAYHVMNDPAMDLWTDVPDQFMVTHMPNVPPNSGTFAVNVKDNDGATNLNNALVCAWVKGRAGEHWSAYTDASGNVNLPVMASTPGDTMYVTVTRHNYQPYEGHAMVVVPANITIAPDHIPVNTATAVTATVTEPEAPYSGIDSIVVTISGLGVNPALVVTTDVNGVANFNVFPLYGELLSVTGRKIGEGYDMFRDTIWVTGGLDFTSADVSVTVPDLGLVNVLTPDYEGVFDATCDPAGFTLLASGCGVNINSSTAGGSLQALGTPTSVGTVTANIVKMGYNVYAETFPCRIVYGTLAGQVTEQGSGTPVVGVRLRGWVSGADTTATPVKFSVTTNGTGNYAAPDSVVVGQYDVYASKFGYIDTMVVPMVVYGPNTYNFAIEAAPSGDVSGAVTEAGTGMPLYGTIRVYRSDDNSLYATVYSDTLAGGAYSVAALPYFNYRFEVTAYQHRKAVRTVAVNSPSRTEDFVLEVTQGDILVINDDDGAKDEGTMLRTYEDTKMGIEEAEKIRSEEVERDAAKAGEAAVQIAAMLTELGYSVTSEQAASTNPATWSGYDAVVWSCGADINPVSVAAYRTNLINYVTAGGKVLLEGGEVGYDCRNDAAFVSTVMHANTWNTDEAGALILQQSGHALATAPNTLPASLAINSANYADQDAMTPSNGGVAVYGTTDYPADGGIIAYDAGGDPSNGNVVYYAFNFRALADSLTRAQALENTVEYLIKPSAPPSSALSGVARLSGQSDHSGIVVSAQMGVTTYYDTTDAAGNYSMTVYDGTYQVAGTKAGYVDTASNRQVTVAGSGSTNFVLYPVTVAYQSDFEANNGGLSGTGDWQYGTPTSGPGTAYSGTKLWATNLAGNYANSSNSTLTLPVLNNLAADSRMEFWMWFDSELRWDGGNVKASTNGGSTWTVINPVPGQKYDTIASTSTAGIAGEWCYSGHNRMAWAKATFNLSSYAGQNLTLRLHFGSDGSVYYPGWYVDDIRVYSIDYTGVTGGTTENPVPAAYALNQATPNPFSGRTTIRFALPRAAQVSLAVYNIAGQKVRTLTDGAMPAGNHSVTWDGRTDDGQRVAGGVYLYRLMTPDYQSTKRMVYIR